MKSECPNSADSLAENTLNTLEFVSPICLPKPKNLDIIEKWLHRPFAYKIYSHFTQQWRFGIEWLIMRYQPEILPLSLSSCVSNRNARHMGKNLHLQAIIINPQMGGSSLWLLTNEFFKLLIIGPSQAKNNYSFVFPSWFNPGGHPYIMSSAEAFLSQLF